MNLLSGLFGGGSDGPSAADGKTLFDFTVQDANGADVKLDKYKGAKAFVVVNVATNWGLTAQNYKEFTEVYSKYSPEGLEILGFPCNQFGKQEPGSNAEIQAFAKNKGAKYPIFGKVDVNGDSAIPLYKWLKASKSSLLGADIKWNFSKFLLDSEGRVVERYAPTDSPLSMVKDIESLLNKA